MPKGSAAAARTPLRLLRRQRPFCGAVSAVLFAYILFEPWKLIFVFFIPVPAIIFAILYVAYSIWSGKRGNSNINHSAHLWGAAYGVIVTILIEPRILPHFLNKLAQLPF